MKKLNNKRKSPLEVARQYGHNNIHFNYKSTGASPTLFKLKKDKYKINNPTVDNSLKEKEKFKEHDVTIQSFTSSTIVAPHDIASLANIPTPRPS